MQLLEQLPVLISGQQLLSLLEKVREVEAPPLLLARLVPREEGRVEPDDRVGRLGGRSVELIESDIEPVQVWPERRHEGLKGELERFLLTGPEGRSPEEPVWFPKLLLAVEKGRNELRRLVQRINVCAVLEKVAGELARAADELHVISALCLGLDIGERPERVLDLFLLESVIDGRTLVLVHHTLPVFEDSLHGVEVTAVHEHLGNSPVLRHVQQHLPDVALVEVGEQGSGVLPDGSIAPGSVEHVSERFFHQRRLLDTGDDRKPGIHLGLYRVLPQ